MRTPESTPGTVTVLGIESSCDDTSASIVRCVRMRRPEILSCVVHGQSSLHAGFGGIVPEIAARAHAEKLDVCTKEALDAAGMSLKRLDAIAATAGPGLVGGLLAGVSFAKGLCAGAGKPLVGVNHLAAHALTVRLVEEVEFPYLALLVSGGHCQLLAVIGADEYWRIGGTVDDAPGEALDKTARHLGLEQPGGPALERIAMAGDARRFALPRPML
ncbi:MAG: tRNA (adenosine(37)-N6)-threonylcarbamoyltransferase complex transferase subunit TsaD, partial [Rhodobacteraceae bacterium]|nr:tRNA (adenosine(37)-N6)-threonylcarbamoyltransferase complex transferase subunit TsaD [Paracoccaceae bacterium]